MGANSNIAMEVSQNYMTENPEHFQSQFNDEPKSEYQLMVERLISREKTLSYSSLKNLDSPRNFMRYLLEPRKPQTDSQKLGSLIDVLILTPQDFDKKYVILESAPTTDLQVAFCNGVLSKLRNGGSYNEDDVIKIMNDIFKDFYKKGSAESLNYLASYVLAIHSKKDVVTKDLHEKAKLISENLLNQPEIIAELEIIEETQKLIEFEYKGWKFKSFLDTYSPTLFHDLKFATDCSPEKFEYDVRKFNYDIQFGLYDLGLEILGLSQLPEFKFIVYDANLNYSIIDVDRSYIQYGRKKVEFLVNCLDKMVNEGAFEKSYNFFKSKTRFYKPNWAPGFDNEIFEIESE